MESIKYKISRDEGGYIVVETIGVFIPFVLLVVSILSLVNITALQARVHYALTQAANTLSMYSYTLEVLGVANDMITLDSKADKVAGEVNAMQKDIIAVLSGLDSIAGNGNLIAGGADVITGGSSAASRAYGWGEAAIGNPKIAIQYMMNYGLNELRNSVFEQLARPLVGRYLANGDMTGDAYLISAGVVNKHTGAAGLNALEFYEFSNLGLGNSVLINKNGDVKLVVEYEVLYTFGGLPLPFSPTLKITQTVVTKAWLNGSGKGYWDGARLTQ